MASSSFCELTLRQRGAVVGFVRRDGSGSVAEKNADRPILGNLPVQFTLRRSPDFGRVLDLSLGGDTFGRLRVVDEELSGTLPDLEREFGETSVVCRSVDGEETEPILELHFEVSAAPEFRQFHDAIVRDLEMIHASLALDVLARTSQRRGELGRASTIVPRDEFERLTGLVNRMEGALTQIGRQPSSALKRTLQIRSWRPGMRIRSSDIPRATLDAGFVMERDVVRAVGRAAIQTNEVSTDIIEHRQIAAGIDRIGARCRGLAVWCERSSQQYERDRVRWSGVNTDESIYRREYAPKVEALQNLALRFADLGRRARRLRTTYEFLDGVPASPTPVEPTPIFLGRSGYRNAYGVLREIERRTLISLAGDDAKLHFKSVSRLYEYWCFIRVVTELGRMIGPPIPPSSFRVIDEIYRPDLDPGQTFGFRDARGAVVFATYEPDLRPWRPSGAAPLGRPEAAARAAADIRPSLNWSASLASEPLRPDILIETCVPGRPVAALVLDAKCKKNVRNLDLWEATDYRSRIFDPADGRQPIRQVYFLHPQEASDPFDNLPGYLSGRRGSIESSIIGAACLTPSKPDDAIRIVQRFLDLAGVLRREMPYDDS